MRKLTNTKKTLLAVLFLLFVSVTGMSQSDRKTAQKKSMEIESITHREQEADAAHDSVMYLRWKEDVVRDSIFQGEFSWNKYDKESYIKNIKSVESLSRYTESNKSEFGFLFGDPSRFKDGDHKISAIVFQGTPELKKIQDEIRYITLDDSYNVPTTAGIMPVYGRGYQEIIDYFNDMFYRSHEEGEDHNLSGSVVLGFIIHEDGKVGKVKIIETTNNELDKKAYRMVKSMHDWRPAMNGHRVPLFLAIQLIFVED